MRDPTQATYPRIAANIIGVQLAAKADADVSMMDFVKAGLPTALLTLALTAAWLGR